MRGLFASCEEQVVVNGVIHCSTHSCCRLREVASLAVPILGLLCQRHRGVRLLCISILSLLVHHCWFICGWYKYLALVWVCAGRFRETAVSGTTKLWFGLDEFYGDVDFFGHANTHYASHYTFFRVNVNQALVDAHLPPVPCSGSFA